MNNSFQKFHSHPVFTLLLCALLWSTSGILIKLVTWNAFAISSVRSLIAVIIICLFTRRFPKKITLDMIITGIVYSATMILFVFANQHTTAANAILLQYTNPVFVILMAHFVLGEKARWFDFIAIIGVFGGMILFFIDDVHLSVNIGNVLGLASGVTFAATTVFLRKQRNNNPTDSFIVAHGITFLVGIPFIFTAGVPSTTSVIGLVLLGVFHVGIPSILYSIGVSYVTALSTVLITMIEPIMNPIWVALMYGEIPSENTILGGSVILFFIFLRAMLQNKLKRRS